MFKVIQFYVKARSVPTADPTGAPNFFRYFLCGSENSILRNSDRRHPNCIRIIASELHRFFLCGSSVRILGLIYMYTAACRIKRIERSLLGSREIFSSWIYYMTMVQPVPGGAIRPWPSPRSSYKIWDIYAYARTPQVYNKFKAIVIIYLPLLF